MFYNTDPGNLYYITFRPTPFDPKGKIITQTKLGSNRVHLVINRPLYYLFNLVL